MFHYLFLGALRLFSNQNSPQLPACEDISTHVAFRSISSDEPALGRDRAPLLLFGAESIMTSLESSHLYQRLRSIRLDQPGEVPDFVRNRYSSRGHFLNITTDRSVLDTELLDWVDPALGGLIQQIAELGLAQFPDDEKVGSWSAVIFVDGSVPLENPWHVDAGYATLFLNLNDKKGTRISTSVPVEFGGKPRRPEDIVQLKRRGDGALISSRERQKVYSEVIPVEHAGPSEEDVLGRLGLAIFYEHRP